MNKTDQAFSIYQKMAGSKRADVVRAIAEELDTSNSNASTYYSRIEKNGGERSMATVGKTVEATPTAKDYNDLSTKEIKEISERIAHRFDVLERQAKSIRHGNLRSFVVSGAAGVGKTFALETELADLMDNDGETPCKFISGGISAVGLYMALYQMRKGGILVLDDCDDVFYDDTAINLLKKVLDTSSRRRASWQKKSDWVYIRDFNLDLEGEPDDNDKLPNWFDFDGQVVFLTNQPLYALSQKDNKMAPHYRALISRSLYLDLTLQSVTDRIIRIRDVFMTKMVPNLGISKAQATEILEFTLENKDKYIDLSLRMMVHQANLLLGDEKNWKDDARTMLMINAI
jgi:hypothetical protein